MAAWRLHERVKGAAGFIGILVGSENHPLIWVMVERKRQARSIIAELGDTWEGYSLKVHVTGGPIRAAAEAANP